MTDQRDHDLGRRIAALPVPDHGSDFWARLDQRLSEETVDEVAEARARRRRGRLAIVVPLATVAALVAAVLAFVGSTGDEDAANRVDTTPAEPSPDTVTQMVTGTVEILERPGGTGPLEGMYEYTFARAIDGSWAVTMSANGETDAYDAVNATRVSWRTSSGSTQVHKDTDVAPGPPDTRAIGIMPSLEDFVLASAAAGDDRIRDGEKLGRATFAFAGELPVNKLSGERGPKTVRITVDKQTGVLLDYQELSGDTVVRQSVVRQLDTGATIDRSRFNPTPPAGATATTVNAGFLPRQKTENDPFVEGWKLVEIRRSTSEAMTNTGPEGSNPISNPVESYVFADGWRRVVVTARNAAGNASSWDDPFRGEGQVFDDVKPWKLLDYEGQIVVDPQSVPHLWGIGTGSVVTVSGPLDADQLADFAEAVFGK